MASGSTNALERSDSSPPKDKGALPSSSSVNLPGRTLSTGIGHAKTEAPKLPASNYDIPPRSRDDPLIIGNKKFEFSLRMDGRLGLIKPRENTKEPAVDCNLNVDEYTRAVKTLIKHVLSDLYRLKKTLSDPEIEQRVDALSDILTRGVCVMTYNKLRTINIARPAFVSSFRPKPKVAEPFEVPVPFALAISQLGVVEVSSLTKRMTCYPTAPATAAATYFLPRKADWSQAAYGEAVRQAKDLGMTFSTVDLSVKVGSSWWLFKPQFNEDVFSLRCILPEDNYTLAGAVVRTLFHVDATAGPAPELFNLSGIEDADYGSFIRGPREGIALSSYYAVTTEGPEDLWKSSV